MSLSAKDGLYINEYTLAVTRLFRGIMKSGGAVNHYVSGVIASLLHLRMEDEYIDLLIKTYGVSETNIIVIFFNTMIIRFINTDAGFMFKERMGAVCEVLDRFLPNCCSYRKPDGGYFVWIHLPSGILFNQILWNFSQMYTCNEFYSTIIIVLGCDGEKFIGWCQKELGVTALPGARFSNTGESKNCLRLSIAFHRPETLRTAVEIMCKGLLRYIRNNVNDQSIS